MNRVKYSTACLAVLLLSSATVTLAQAPGRGLSPGGFGGPPGGPGRFGGMPQPSVMLLEMPEVRAELAIPEELNPQLDQLLSKLQDELRATFESGFRDAFNLTEEERRTRLDDLRKTAEALAAEADKQLAGILDTRQIKRLNQLQLQREGLDAFSRADVVRQLGLSDEQQKKIRGLEEAARPQFGFGPPDFPQMEERRRQALAETIRVLTGVQKAKWAELTGEQFRFPQPQFGPGGPGRFGPGGFGPGGPMGGPARQLVKQFDANGDGWLNKPERAAARAALAARDGDRTGPGFGPRGRGPAGPFGRGNRAAPPPGPNVSPSAVATYPAAPLYDPTTLRTIFLDFDNSDWETELEDFHNSDVDVPATLTVDGKHYPNVGVHFRGMSSYGMVPTGYKRSLNISLDFIDQEQRLYGYKTLNLLNCSGDPSFMSTVLYSHIARQFIPAPKANFVKVVINGESWGVYSNVQQFDKVFLEESYESSQGTRWKVRGNPGADGGLRYFGDDLEEYKRRFEMKSGDGDKAWQALIELCRTLNETPVEGLEAALEPILDIDGVLRFLALDVALVNSDGYWTRASDYSIFRDKQGKFHVIPHDMNEAFQGGGGPGGFGPPGFGPPGFGPPGFGPREAGRPEARGSRDRGPGGSGPPFGRGGPGGRGPGGFGPPGHGGVDLDPLVAIDNPRMPLRSRLLAVPKLRAKYLAYVRSIAETSLDWKSLGPVVAQQRTLIEREVEADTRKLDSFDAFARATADEAKSENAGRAMSLRSFADQRRQFLLDYLQRPQDPATAE